MNKSEVMEELKVCGTEQNRKVYKRHGVGGKMYGVSFANLGKLKKKIKVDHALAQELWATGNHDARILATMIADPAQMNDRLVESWAKDLDNYVLTDIFSGLVSHTALARKKIEKWTKSKSEWIGQAGWNLVGQYALHDQELPDDYFENYLGVIERNIHSGRNRVKHAMNMALIGIGSRNGKLEERAVAAAKKIGKVIVDHGDTNCKTPDAIAYIQKMKQRKLSSSRQG